VKRNFVLEFPPNRTCQFGGDIKKRDVVSSRHPDARLVMSPASSVRGGEGSVSKSIGPSSTHSVGEQAVDLSKVKKVYELDAGGIRIRRHRSNPFFITDETAKLLGDQNSTVHHWAHSVRVIFRDQNGNVAHELEAFCL